MMIQCPRILSSLLLSAIPTASTLLCLTVFVTLSVCFFSVSLCLRLVTALFVRLPLQDCCRILTNDAG